jgi:fatty acid desaturase
MAPSAGPERPGDIEGAPLGLNAELRRRLAAAGCFRRAPALMAVHMAAVLAAFGCGYALLLTGPPAWLRGFTLLGLAIASVHAGIVAHDAGHGTITRRPGPRLLLGLVFNTLLTGLCWSHFQRIHTRHHAHCNEREEDQDMRSSILSLYPEAAAEKRTTFSRLVTRHQAWLLWPLVSLQGFELKVDSVATLRSDAAAARLDGPVLALHVLLWLVPPTLVLGLPAALLNYALLTWLIGPYLGAVFIPNHIGMRVIAPGERLSALDQQRITTRNLGDSWLSELFFGGLNHHVEHHMFPRIPAPRLRVARRITRAFCREHGLAYHETSWPAAMRGVLVYLNRIGRSLDARPASLTPT